MSVTKICTGQDIEFGVNGRTILGIQKDRSASVATGDFDQDGDVDIVVANGRHWPSQNKIYLNNGSRVFTVSKPLGNQEDTSQAAELADLDGDGDLDVAVGNAMAPNLIYTNNGNATLSETATFGIPYAPTRNLKVIDLDNGGDQDILITNRGRQNEICLDDDRGKFTKHLGFGSIILDDF